MINPDSYDPKFFGARAVLLDRWRVKVADKISLMQMREGNKFDPEPTTPIEKMGVTGRTITHVEAQK